MFSQVDPSLTLEKIRNQNERHFFDRKSARISSKRIAEMISGFCNADGGLLAIGIEDNGNITGLELDDTSENRCHQAPYEFLESIPDFKIEFVPVIDDQGNIRNICLYHLPPVQDKVIKLKTGDAFIRQGDHTVRLTTDMLLRLEYTRGIRSFEEGIVEEATINDLDNDLIEEYRKVLNPESSSAIDLLIARGVVRRKEGDLRITNAGIILFGKCPTQFLPSARLRFLRYDGIDVGVGTNLNIIKDVTLEKPLHIAIGEARALISAQMRDFQRLDRNGRFTSVSEYPEFAWLEGLVNAVTHRDYSISGDYIRISMFDDRIEFLSPGELPSIVTIENIMTTRYSRNPIIARVLTDFGWVRELNEGVKRIYIDMENFFLDPPEYSEPRGCVSLLLRNNIAMRSLRKLEALFDQIDRKEWDNLSDLEWSILTKIANKDRCSLKDLMDITNKSRFIVQSRLSNLMSAGFVEEHRSSPQDPTKYYTVSTKI